MNRSINWSYFSFTIFTMIVSILVVNQMLNNHQLHFCRFLITQFYTQAIILLFLCNLLSDIYINKPMLRFLLSNISNWLGQICSQVTIIKHLRDPMNHGNHLLKNSESIIVSLKIDNQFILEGRFFSKSAKKHIDIVLKSKCALLHLKFYTVLNLVPS